MSNRAAEMTELPTMSLIYAGYIEYKFLEMDICIAEKIYSIYRF